MADGEKERTIRVAVCGCSCFILFIAGFLVSQYLLLIFTEKAIDGAVMMHDLKVQEFCDPNRTLEYISQHMHYPGCMSIVNKTAEEVEKCSEPCYSVEFVRGLEDFNRKYPGKLVSYPSRVAAGTLNTTLKGWWAPAPPEVRKRLAKKAHGERPPLIIIQHGFTSNSNKYRQHVAAYLLRKIGFNVIINNFRDHCYSANTTQHIFQWGHSYAYDVLGAWDYVQKDPDGELGGPTPREKVGLLGFSKGGFISLNAFGLEGDIIGAWVDAPPLDLEDVIAYGGRREFEDYGLPTSIANFLAKFYVTPVCNNMQAAAGEYGVNLFEHKPLECLAKGPPTQRPLKWVGNTMDTKVLYEWGDKLLTFLSHHKDKYNVTSKTFTEMCQDEDHCTDHIRQPVLYSNMMCDFWIKAMKLPADYCTGLAEEIPGTKVQRS